jgi:hypothetical protein
MFDSEEQLAHQIAGTLSKLREAAGGKEACVFERKGLLFESTADGEGGTLWPFLQGRREAVFSIPEGLAGEGPKEDLFEGWEGQGLLLAFINGRVALALTCQDVEVAEESILPGVRALADFLLRFEASYRLDEKGGGLFFGSPRLDLVLVSPPEG